MTAIRRGYGGDRGATDGFDFEATLYAAALSKAAARSTGH